MHLSEDPHGIDIGVSTAQIETANHRQGLAMLATGALLLISALPGFYGAVQSTIMVLYIVYMHASCRTSPDDSST